MSMQSDCGAIKASDDIIELAKRLIGENRGKPEVVKALKKVIAGAKGISAAANKGWY